MFVVFSRQPTLALPATFAGQPQATQSIDLLVKLPLRNAAELETLTQLEADPQSPLYHHFLSVAQFRARYAPLRATIRQAVFALQTSGLRVTKIDSQLLHVTGTVAAVERTFGVRMGLARDRRGAHISAMTEPVLSPGLTALNAIVVGLTNTATVQPQSRRVGPIGDNRVSPSGPYWFDDLKQAYQYPAYHPFNGKGVTIATVGLSDFNDSDATLYFNHERLGGANALAAQPSLAHLLLGGTPFDPNSGNSNEANLDVQQSAGSAPGATVLGVSVPAAGEGFLYGYSALVESNQVDIVSTSFGECELFYTAAYNGGIDQTKILKAYHDLFLQGNSQGITFVFSSGDAAGRPCPQPGYVYPLNTGKVFLDVPGTSIWSGDPAVTSVGGTNLITTYHPGKLESAYVREDAYHDTILGPIDPYGTGNYVGNALWGSGGGASVIFPKPWYQTLVHTGSMMRTDPDVAMQMGGCPVELNDNGQQVPVRCHPDDSAVYAYVGGTAQGFIGTSVAAPEFAGLLAVLEQWQGNVRLGNVNGYIYRLAQTNTIFGKATVFHQGIPGSNGVVRVARGQLGYNEILGVGTPIAQNFARLPYAAVAGDPQTPSNP